MSTPVRTRCFIAYSPSDEHPESPYAGLGYSESSPPPYDRNFSPMNSPRRAAYSPTAPDYVPMRPLALFPSSPLPAPRSPRYTPAPKKKAPAKEEEKFMVFSPELLDRLLKAPRSSKKDPHSPLSPTENGLDRAKLRWGKQNLHAILPWAPARFAPGRLLRLRAAKKREAIASAKKRGQSSKKASAKVRFAQCEEDLLPTERL